MESIKNTKAPCWQSTTTFYCKIQLFLYITLLKKDIKDKEIV